MRTNHSKSQPGQQSSTSLLSRRGVILVAVLLVTSMLSLAAYQYCELMTSEHKASENAGRYAQARAAAESGIHYVMGLLADPDAMATMLNNSPWDNPSVFQGVTVRDDEMARNQVKFSVVSPRDGDDGSNGPRFGVTCEGGKLHLNALIKADKTGKQLYAYLMKLPNMTSDIACCIVDWLDADDTVSSYDGVTGAENEYYTAQSPPSKCKNGPLDSLEELLLIKGMSQVPQLLFGVDRNRNGIQDGDESSADGLFDRGWLPYLTIYGREPNKDSEGNPRIDINGTDLVTLYTSLNDALGDAEFANYVMMYRIYGPAAAGGNTNSKSKLVEGSLSSITSESLKLDTAKATKTVATIWDLHGTSVQITQKSEDPKEPDTIINYACPLNDTAKFRALAPLLFDKVTTSQDTEHLGRICINTAPETVLNMLVGNGMLTDIDVQTILNTRPQFGDAAAPDEIFHSPAWLITEANLKAATLAKLDKYITTRSQVYYFQVVGYFEGGGPTVRMEAVVDVNFGKPRILYQRDITGLGKGYDFTATSN